MNSIVNITKEANVLYKISIIKIEKRIIISTINETVNFINSLNCSTSDKIKLKCEELLLISAVFC